MRTPRIALALAAAACAAVGACGDSGSDDDAGGSTTAGSDPVRIVLSNNFMGNEWRPQMVNIAEYVASAPPYGDNVELSVQLSDATPAAQIASLQSIIRDEPDAIAVDAASATALNPTIEQACAAGITVISFDQTVTAPCALKIGKDYGAAAADELRWLAAHLDGRGKILMDKGLPGVPLSEDMVQVWNEMLESDYPDIEVVGTYNSEFTEAVEQQAVSSQLARHREVDGVLSQVSCSAVINAFEKAGRDPVPVGCNAYNRGQIACVEKDVPCFFYPTPAYIGGIAIERAYQVVAEDRDQPEFEDVGGDYMVSPAGEIDFEAQAADVVPLEAGVNYYPDASPALSTPVTYGDWDITPAIALGE